MPGKPNLVLFAAAAVLVLPSVGLTLRPNTQELEELLLVQVPLSANPTLQGTVARSAPRDRCVDGARIVRANPSRDEAAVLTPGFAGACDPDVSSDGETIVFSGKRDPEDSWQIWTMDADGSGKIQITRGPGVNVAPVFAGARFYLDDPQPTPQIIFSRTRHETGPFSLFGTDLEGSALHRLTFNPHSDFSPAVLPTGRVVFTSRQRYGDRYEPDGVFALMAINIDGSDLMPFYGNHEMPLYKDGAAVSPSGGRVYFVEADSLSWLGGGSLAFVEWRRPLRSYRKLDGEADGPGVFHSPAPLPDGGLLASYRSQAPGSVFALYRLDSESGLPVEKLFEQSGWHSIDVQVLAPHPPLKGRSNWLVPGATTGVFYCLDAYRTSLGEGGSPSVAPPGAIKHVRVIEGLPNRILGVAPVEEDGSFHIRVPAETPITFQLLDEDYVALRTQRAWTWVMGNENRGCIGCHDDRELSPPNRMVSAIAKPPVDLVPPTARPHTVDFRNEIAPILASSCATAGCHVSGQVEPVLGKVGTAMPESALRDLYRSLLERPAGPSTGPYVVPGRARQSQLIQRLLERNTDSRIPMDKHHDVLGQGDLLLFIEWVDLGAGWESQPGDEGRAP